MTNRTRLLLVMLFVVAGVFAGSTLASGGPNPVPTNNPDHAGYLAALAAGPDGSSWYDETSSLIIGYGENACFTMHDNDTDHATIQAYVIELGADTGRWTLEQGMLLTSAAFTHLCPEWNDLIGMVDARVRDMLLLRGTPRR